MCYLFEKLRELNQSLQHKERRGHKSKGGKLYFKDMCGSKQQYREGTCMSVERFQFNPLGPTTANMQSEKWIAGYSMNWRNINSSGYTSALTGWFVTTVFHYSIIL